MENINGVDTVDHSETVKKQHSVSNGDHIDAEIDSKRPQPSKQMSRQDTAGKYMPCVASQPL